MLKTIELLAMGKLNYTVICSLDGFIEDAAGKFDWAMPSDEVHAFVNDLERSCGTEIYGRRMYETMKIWETLDATQMRGPVRDFQEIWLGMDKIVYSSSLESVSTARTELRGHFDIGEVRALKESSPADIAIGGAKIAAQAFTAGLVDEVRLLLAPVSVGGGKRALPADQVVELELLDSRAFADGFVHLRYAVV